MAARKKTTPTNTIAEENVEMTAETTENPFETVEHVEAEQLDLDVDAPEVTDAEDTVVEPATAEEKPKKEKAPSRPPVPEGKVSPVQFAKILSKHLSEKRGEEVTVAPQVVYSYIKNNGEGSKHPFPATKAEGRAAVVDATEALAWWDAKDERVKASKSAAAEKAAKKSEKANKPAETVTAAEEQPAEITEAE
jgi:hypothetical protein